MRYAQRHWLKLQADAAVSAAMTVDATLHQELVALDVTQVDLMFGGNARAGLEFARDRELMVARDALINAELYHREIVRRNSTGEGLAQSSTEERPFSHLCPKCNNEMLEGYEGRPVLGVAGSIRLQPIPFRKCVECGHSEAVLNA